MPHAAASKENDMQRLLILATLLLAGSYASAQGVSYNYLELGYQRVDLDNGPTGDGFSLGGSVSFTESWYAVAGYGTADFNFGADLDQINIGAGYHLPLSENTDLFAELAYIDVSAGADGFVGLGDNGFGVTIGARGMLTPRFELRGTAGYFDLGGGADGTALGVEGWYSFGGKFAAGITANFEEDVTSLGLAVRWYMDR
jgi:hypothetical protein